MSRQAYVLYIVLWIGLALFDAVISPSWRIGLAQGSFVIATLACVMMLSNAHELPWQGVLIAGIVLDLLGGNRFGAAALSLLLTAILLHQASRWLAHQASIPLLVLFAAAGSVLYTILGSVLNGTFLLISFEKMLADALYTGVLSVVVFAVWWLVFGGALQIRKGSGV